MEKFNYIELNSFELTTIEGGNWGDLLEIGIGVVCVGMAVGATVASGGAAIPIANVAATAGLAMILEGASRIKH